MTDTATQDEVIQRLIQSGEERATVRTMLLTSTRAIQNAPLDVFSDYDVILVVTDIRPFYEDRSWLEDFGKVLVAYWDLIELEYGMERFGNVIQYEDGLKIDFALWPIALLKRIARQFEERHRGLVACLFVHCQRLLQRATPAPRCSHRYASFPE